MPISSLPDSTLRAITSTLVLNDAASVVKELIDNALDAKATTIAIEISANTLDVIQVRDNGTGIGVEDRQLVCKRGCTSKITSIEDLERLGGSSLGFRGEALASVADISDSVTLTTRVDGEKAGSMLKYGPAGALLSCSSASHPVGSTLRIKDFLKSIPVRKQTALKNVTKTLSTIKKLLQSYAFARETVRFSFKVLKGKNDKANWQYSPVDNPASLRGTAVRIIGKDAAGRYELRRKTASVRGEKDVANDQYSVVALLASTDKDAITLNTGHYISIDSRPVSAARGTIKEIVKLYRYYVRNSAANARELPASFDPFLVMHITCPRGSYDVNVEPAKDEVMFIDSETVLSLVDSIFKDYYGEKSQSSISTGPKYNTSFTHATSSSFDFLLAKRPVPSIEPLQQSQDDFTVSTSPQQAHPQAVTFHSVTAEPGKSQDPSISPMACSSKDSASPSVAPRKGLWNIYGLDTEDEETPPPSPSSPDVDQDMEELRDDNAKNPWSIAKLNAPVRHSSMVDDYTSFATHQTSPSIVMQQDPVRLRTTSQSNEHRQPLGPGPQLPSPITSPHSPDLFQNPGPPNRPWPSRQRRDEDSELDSEPNILPASPDTQVSEATFKPLDIWAKPIRQRTELTGFKRVSDIYDKDGIFEQPPESDRPEISASQSQPVRMQPSLDLANQLNPQHKRPIGCPLRLPLLRSPTDGPAIEGSTLVQQAAPGSQQPPFKLSQSQIQELDQIMDFEHRKKTANAQHRKILGKGTGRGLNIAKLVQLQRSTITAQDDDEDVDPEHPLQDHASEMEQASGTAAFGDRFSRHDNGPQVSQKSNPHRNRYLAAAKALTQIEDDRSSESINGDAQYREVGETVEEEARTMNMAKDDPRAYLMRHQFQMENANARGLSETGLRIRRTKTQRLPLESVPIDMMVNDLLVQVDFDIGACAESGPIIDRYSNTGKNEFITWTANMTNIGTWQGELTKLVDGMYKVQVGNELMPPNIELDLRKIMKTHCDNI